MDSLQLTSIAIGVIGVCNLLLFVWLLEERRKFIAALRDGTFEKQVRKYRTPVMSDSEINYWKKVLGED